MKTFLLLSLLGSFTLSRADPYGAVMVASGGDIRSEQIEFHRRALDVINRDQLWNLAETDKKKFLKDDTEGTYVGAIPVVYAYKAAHLKRYADTHALHGIFVSECLGNKDLYSECSVSVYSPDKDKKIAEVRKTFSHGVYEPSVWAERLTIKLHHGLKNHRLSQERDRLSSILKSDYTPQDPTQLEAAFHIAEESFTTNQGEFSATGYGVSMGARSGGHYLGLLATLARRQTDNDEMWRSYFVGPQMRIEARALKNMVWNLHLAAGFAHRSLATELGVTGEAGPMVAVGPGVGWRVLPETDIGLDYDFRTYFNGRSQQGGYGQFRRSSGGFGFQVRVRF